MYLTLHTLFLDMTESDNKIKYGVSILVFSVPSFQVLIFTSTMAKISPFSPILILKDYFQEYPISITQLLFNWDLLLKIS